MHSGTGLPVQRSMTLLMQDEGVVFVAKTHNVAFDCHSLIPAASHSLTSICMAIGYSFNFTLLRCGGMGLVVYLLRTLGFDVMSGGSIAAGHCSTIIIAGPTLLSALAQLPAC